MTDYQFLLIKTDALPPVYKNVLSVKEMLAKGEASNMYGYYYPCTSKSVGVNDLDWTKEKWIEKSINEDYNYLKTIKSGQVTKIQSLVSSIK